VIRTKEASVLVLMPVWVVVLVLLVVLAMIIWLATRDTSHRSGPEQAASYREWREAKDEVARALSRWRRDQGEENTGALQRSNERLRAATEARRSAPVTAPTDPIEQIRRLGELRDQGALTEEEFAAKKRHLLERTT
jgi:putative oligomerization/nucleic acid binding protein